MAQFIIREASRGDCSEIRRLIQELADFEKMPNGPKINAEVLERDGFDSDPPCYYCYVAEPCSPSESVENISNINSHKNEEAGTEVSGKSGVTTRTLVGYALYYFSYSTWNGKCVYLEDVYVTPQCRNMKLGKTLFSTVAKKCYDLGCKRLEFSVLNWNPATEFYKRLGAVDLTSSEDWHSFRLTGEALEKIALSKM